MATGVLSCVRKKPSLSLAVCGQVRQQSSSPGVWGDAVGVPIQGHTAHTPAMGHRRGAQGACPPLFGQVSVSLGPVQSTPESEGVLKWVWVLLTPGLAHSHSIHGLELDLCYQS